MNNNQKEVYRSQPALQPQQSQIQPQQYYQSQPSYPQPTQQPIKKKSTGKTVAIVILSALLGVSLIFNVVIGGVIKLATTSDSSNSALSSNQHILQSPYENSSDAQPDFIIDNVQEFVNEIKNNSLKAEEKYNGKIIQFNNVYITNDMYKDSMNNIVVKFYRDEIYCQFFSEQQDQLSEFQKGDRITFKGQCKIGISSFSMERCVLLSGQP